MDANPGAREHWMVRWTFLGVAGDLATPLLFAVLTFVALGWRTAFVASGVLLLGYAALLWTREFPSRAAIAPARALVPIRSAVGLLGAERLLGRARPLPLLAAFSALGAVAYVGWVFAPTVAASGAMLFVVGLLTAPLYPLAKAQAYRSLPDQAGMVNAVGRVFAPLDLAVPLGLGLVADHVGLVAALLLLVAQPVGLFWIAVRDR